jgi:hypothetical protein
MPVYNYNFWYRGIDFYRFGKDFKLQSSAVAIIDASNNAVLHEYSDCLFLEFLIEEFIDLTLEEGVNWEVGVVAGRMAITLLDGATVLAYWDIHDEYYNIEGGVQSSPSVVLYFNDYQFNFFTCIVKALTNPVTIDFLNQFKRVGAADSWLQLWTGVSPVTYHMRAFYLMAWYRVEIPLTTYAASDTRNYQINFWDSAIVNPSFPNFNNMQEGSPRQIKIKTIGINKFSLRAYGEGRMLQIHNEFPLTGYHIRVYISGTQINDITYHQVVNLSLKQDVTYIVEITTS